MSAAISIVVGRLNAIPRSDPYPPTSSDWRQGRGSHHHAPAPVSAATGAPGGHAARGAQVGSGAVQRGQCHQAGSLQGRASRLHTASLPPRLAQRRSRLATAALASTATTSSRRLRRCSSAAPRRATLTEYVSPTHTARLQPPHVSCKPRPAPTLHRPRRRRRRSRAAWPSSKWRDSPAGTACERRPERLTLPRVRSLPRRRTSQTSRPRASRSESQSSPSSRP